jgi:hypothetical protein
MESKPTAARSSATGTAQIVLSIATLVVALAALIVAIQVDSDDDEPESRPPAQTVSVAPGRSDTCIAFRQQVLDLFYQRHLTPAAIERIIQLERGVGNRGKTSAAYGCGSVNAILTALPGD